MTRTDGQYRLRGERRRATHDRFMLNIADLGFDDTPVDDQIAAEDIEETPFAVAGTPAPLVPDSAAAKALFAIWSGERIVIVDSPPGAGKTELFATVVAHLTQRSDLSVVGAMATRDQVIGNANRLTTQMPATRVNVGMNGATAADFVDGIEIRSRALSAGGSGTGGLPAHHAELRTLASCAMVGAPNCDVLVVDEAYQSTFAQVAKAAAWASQVLLIGDPGQIGPVVTVDTSGWERRRLAPHHRAPDGFAKIGKPVRINLDSTWRLGPRSTAALGPLYDFGFESSRPERTLFGLDEIESFEVNEPANPYDPAMLKVVAEHAAALCDATLVDDSGERSLEPSDVAVVVSHNAQVSGISGLLTSMGVHGVTVGTADRLQGGQWHAVVAIDPFVGHGDGLSPHTLSLGRLCVMASRHATHLSWFHDGQWAKAIDDAELPAKVSAQAKAVRSSLCEI